MYALAQFVSAMPPTAFRKYQALLEAFERYDLASVYEQCPAMRIFSPRDAVLGYAMDTVAFVYMTYVANAPKKLAERGLILAVDIDVENWSATGVIISVPTNTSCEKRRGWILRLGTPRKSVFMPPTPREYFGALTWNFLRRTHVIGNKPCSVQYDDDSFDEEKLVIWANQCTECKQPMEWRAAKDVCSACIFESMFTSMTQETAKAVKAVKARPAVKHEEIVFKLAFPRSELEPLGFVF